MIADTFIWSYAAAMPVVSGMIVFGLSRVRAGAMSNAPRWEIIASGALAFLLLGLSILLLPPHWLSMSIRQSQQQALESKHDQDEIAADLSAIAAHRISNVSAADQKAFETLWKFSRKDLPFPLKTMTNTEADEFVATQIAAFDDGIRQMGWRLSAARDHCELRQWDAQQGDWNSPLIVWFMRPGNPEEFMADRMSYFGFARFRDGAPAGVVSQNVLAGAGVSRLIDSMIFNKYGGNFNLYRQAAMGDQEPVDTENEFIVFISEEPIPIATNARLVNSELKSLPDSRFQLTLFLAGDVQRYVVAAEDPRLNFIKQLIDDPQDPADDEGFPVQVQLLYDPENVAKHRFGITISKDRKVFSWQKKHPGAALHGATFMMRTVRAENNPGDPSDTTTKRSALRWIYETTYTQMPELKGEIRCVGKPPGEVRALLKLTQ